VSFVFTSSKIAKNLSLALLLSVSAAAAHAHQVWVERSTPTGPAQVYFGEIDEERPDEGEPVQKLLATTRVFGADPQKVFKLSFKQDHLEAQPEGPGDVRMINDQVWAPFKNRDGLLQAIIFNSRAGRVETAAAMDLEFVPVQANGDTIALVFKGEPVADKEVTVINPALWKKTLKTDKQGRITVPDAGKGRYILLYSHEVKGDVEIGGAKAQILTYVTSLSFIVN